MNNADYVDALISDQKAQGTPLQTVAWNAALACVGWPYVFGARGQYCTPANRRARYRDDHPTIKSACKNYDGTGSCSGCKWYPGAKRVRMFDCRGFTYWVLKATFDGWELMGGGATSQWNNSDNWTAKGTIDTVPDDMLVCLFVQDDKDKSVMAHTGFGYKGETIECSAGVQYKMKRNQKWTHWGLPKCVNSDPPDPDYRPTLKKGDSGTYVTLMQTMLIQRGYKMPKYGADGKFGNETLDALTAFQKDHGLKADGVCGKDTWDALQNTEPTEYYKVTVPHLTLVQADALLAQWPGAAKEME